jgi:hypothetical protein
MPPQNEAAQAAAMNRSIGNDMADKLSMTCDEEQALLGTFKREGGNLTIISTLMYMVRENLQFYLIASGAIFVVVAGAALGIGIVL